MKLSNESVKWQMRNGMSGQNGLSPLKYFITEGINKQSDFAVIILVIPGCLLEDELTL